MGCAFTLWVRIRYQPQGLPDMHLPSGCASVAWADARTVLRYGGLNLFRPFRVSTPRNSGCAFVAPLVAHPLPAPGPPWNVHLPPGRASVTIPKAPLEHAFSLSLRIRCLGGCTRRAQG